MAKQPTEQQASQQTAARGANKLIDHLAGTGTGRDKLDIAREALGDLGEARTEQEGAEEVIRHLRRRGVTEATVEKARRFVDSGFDAAANPVTGPGAPGTKFNPAATAPGTSAPAVAAQQASPDRDAGGKAK